MAFAGGIFSRLYNFTADAAANIPAQPARFDNELAGIATGLSTCLLRDGSQTVVANIPMGGFKIAGLGVANATGQAITFDQIAAIGGAALIGVAAGGTLQAALGGFIGASALVPYTPLAGGTMTGALLLHDGTVVADVPSGTYYIVGYRDLPQSGGAVKTANYTATSADAGKHILCYGPSLTVTIPSNSSVPYPIGTFLTFINANGLSIAINTDTLTLANSTTTGTRTLALNGIATAIKISATAWLISGAGLS